MGIHYLFILCTWRRWEIFIYIYFCILYTIFPHTKTPPYQYVIFFFIPVCVEYWNNMNCRKKIHLLIIIIFHIHCSFAMVWSTQGTITDCNAYDVPNSHWNEILSFMVILIYIQCCVCVLEHELKYNIILNN